MKIKEMIKEIEEAVDVMVESEDRGESFHNLKKSVVEKIHETEAAADAMLGNDKVDISDEIREKIREVGNASEGLLDLDNDEVSKEVGGKIKELAREIREASDVMLIDDRKK